MRTTGKKIMVIMLSMMMTVSTFITFSFAEEPQDQTQTVGTASAESTLEPAEQGDPAPEPVADNNGGGQTEVVTEDSGETQEEQAAVNDNSGNGTEEVIGQGGNSGQNVDGEEPEDKEKKDDQKEEQKEEDKDKMPAQSFSGSAGGLSVRASAGSGVFPEGTDMNVSSVSSGYVMSAAEGLAGEKGTVVDAKAVDITFTKDGSEIQPAAGSVKVSLSANGSVDGEEHEAVHISGGSASSMGDASASFASFRADHFSIYGIIGVDYEDENVQKQERHTYNFYVDDNLVDTQTVTDEDTLAEPQVPESASGKVFKGWQVTREDDTNIYPPYTPPFGTVDIPVGDHAWTDKTFRVDAVFDETYYVTFYKDVERTSVLRTKAANKGAEITTNDVTFDFGDGKAITGWKNGNETVGSTITVNGDIELIPVISDVNWVTFESNGGTPVAPVYSTGNSAISAPTPPTRSGWNFAGWFMEPGLSTPYDFSKPVTEGFTLYAKWNSAEKVSYTVVYWKQNANDDGYTFVESEEGSNFAGEAATYSGGDTKYEGFTLNRAKSDVDVIIKGNGTTIKNVYYDRKTYPLTFYIYKKGSWWTSSYWEKVDERYFKYQEDTSAFWHNVTQKYKSYQWYISKDSSTFYSYAPPMQPANGSLSDFSGITAYGKTADYSYTIRYLEEDTNREIKEAFTGRTSQRSIMFTNEDHIIIPGFTFSREVAFNRNRVGTLYYSRNTYSLQLFPNGGPAPKERSEYRGIKFEESLARYSPSNYIVGTTTAEFDGITKTFAGWYDNELLDGSPFSFSSTMPALEAVKQTGDKSTLALYAKWVTDEHTVTFDLNGGTIGGASSIEPEIVEAGQTVTQPAGELEKVGFTFGGWETRDGSLFHFDTKITADTDLTAIWHADSNVDIGVVYDAGDKGVFTGKDTKKYHRNAEAVVKGVPEVKDEYRNQGYYFKGWKVGNSDTLVSRGTFVVIEPEQTKSVTEKTLTLKAVYEKKDNTATVTYNSNLPDGTNDSFTDTAELNGNYEMLTYAATGMTDAGDKYEFIGWNNGSEHSLKPGEKAAIGKGGEELYAVWAEKIFHDEEDPDPEPEPDPDPQPEPKPEPDPDPTPEPQPVPAPEPKPIPAPVPKPAPVPDNPVVPANIDKKEEPADSVIRTADAGSGKTDNNGSPKTGDSNSSMFLYIEILSLAVISLIMMLTGRRESGDDSE